MCDAAPRPDRGLVADAALVVACQLHPSSYRHRPAVACGLEFHHLTVRAWQRSLLTPDGTDWLQGIVIPPGATITQSANYGPVWDPAGIEVPRTCHGNVHTGIVALVHSWQPVDGTVISRTYARARLSTTLDAATWASAIRSLTTWCGHEQSVAWLQQHRLWGEL